MKTPDIRTAKECLRSAQRAFKLMTEETGATAFVGHWVDFLEAWRAADSEVQEAVKDLSQEMLERIRQERAEDPLLRYISEAANNELVKSASPSIGFAAFRMISDGKGADIRFEGGVPIGIFDANGERVAEPVQGPVQIVGLNPVKSRTGDTLAPPTAHQGRSIEPKPLIAAELSLRCLEALLGVLDVMMTEPTTGGIPHAVDPPSAILPAYRLKIERAKRHIAELRHEVRAFIASEPWEVYNEDDLATGRRTYRIRIKKHIPREWSTIIGDIIHNARAALDLLMVQVVRFCDPNRQSYNHVHFVIRESKELFEKDLPKNIKGASPAAKQIIEDLKPYKGGNEKFWRLHQLDVLDKHKAIIPVGGAHRNVIVDLVKPLRDQSPDRVSSLPPARIGLRPADRQFPLQDGAAVFTTKIDPSSTEDGQVTLEIAFGEGQILDGEPLDPALANMCRFVEEVIDKLEAGLPGLI